MQYFQYSTMADFRDPDQDRVMSYLRDDLAGRRLLANFMLHAGPKVEEMVTVTFLHTEVVRSAVRPALLQGSSYPVDMVMVPDGDSETCRILTEFLYGDRNNALLVSAAQAAIVGNVLTNLLGVSSSEYLHEIVIESPDNSAAMVTSGYGSPPFSPSSPSVVSALQKIAIGSPIPSRPPAGAVMLQEEVVELLQEEEVLEHLQEGGTVELLQEGGTVELLRESGTVEAKHELKQSGKEQQQVLEIKL